MRRVFIPCASRSAASRRAPWAAKISKADGGYIAFESITDWQIWKGQA